MPNAETDRIRAACAECHVDADRRECPRCGRGYCNEHADLVETCCPEPKKKEDGK